MQITKPKVNERAIVLGSMFAIIATAIALSGFGTIGLVYFIATLPLVARA